jgi:hypothetical protein
MVGGHAHSRPDLLRRLSSHKVQGRTSLIRRTMFVAQGSSLKMDPHLLRVACVDDEQPDIVFAVGADRAT